MAYLIRYHLGPISIPARFSPWPNSNHSRSSTSGSCTTRGCMDRDCMDRNWSEGLQVSRGSAAGLENVGDLSTVLYQLFSFASHNYYSIVLFRSFPVVVARFAASSGWLWLQSSGTGKSQYLTLRAAQVYYLLPPPRKGR